MVKTLIIIRHAHREKLSVGPSDNGLSPKGQKQAKSLTQYFDKKFGDVAAVFYSSPKKRCIETIEPIAKSVKATIKVLDSLDESDTQKQLQSRVRQFEEFWMALDAPLIVACSHGDWIPAFTQKIVGKSIDLDKGGWIELKLEVGLEKVIQSFT